jgi:23S rRNA pseudouridine2605 synthase
MRPRKRIGLARALSKMGHCSRSQAAVLIRAGRVSLNKRTITDPETPVRIDPGRNPQDWTLQEKIAVDGTLLAHAPLIYLVLNKPRGVVTTASDEKGRATVYTLLDPGLPWVGPVGRLDKASEGLLLFTNDSKWSAKIANPSSHLDKKYHVQVGCVANPDLLKKVVRGIADGGEHLCAKSARLLRHGDKNSWLEIILDEGKNRQIRRLLEALNVQVLRLMRVSIGPLNLGDLKKGAVRRLTPEEKKQIDRALGAG